MISPSSTQSFHANSFSLSQISTKSLFDQPPTQLWSRFHWTTPTPMLLSSSEFVASVLTKAPPLFDEQPPPENEIPTVRQSSKIISPMLIFIVGFVLGYLLTNTLPSPLHHYGSFLFEKSVQSFHFFCDYLQLVFEYFSSDTFPQSLS